MKAKNLQQLEPYIRSVENIENIVVSPSLFETIMQNIKKNQTNTDLSWFVITKYKYIVASVIFIVLINLAAIIKVSSEQQSSKSTNTVSEMLADDYNISR